jgi:hypothetical protein
VPDKPLRAAFASKLYICSFIKLRAFKIFSVTLLLSVLVFPMVEKAVHESHHLGDQTCGVRETHYCAVEHECPICSYLVSSTSEPPKGYNLVRILILTDDQFGAALAAPVFIHPRYTFSLRGPPAC